MVLAALRLALAYSRKRSNAGFPFLPYSSHLLVNPKTGTLP